MKGKNIVRLGALIKRHHLEDKDVTYLEYDENNPNVGYVELCADEEFSDETGELLNWTAGEFVWNGNDFKYSTHLVTVD